MIKKTSIQKRGLKAQKNGSEAEEIIIQLAKKYKRAGKAEICKRYEPYKRISKGRGIFKATYTYKAGCDFEIWLNDGRAGHLELKTRKADRIAKNAIDTAQEAQLQRRVSFMQLALILVRLQEDWYLVHFARWYEGERKSHNAKQLAEIGVKVELRNNLPDFLDYI
tara:strand:- start:2786 stop:3283 length:498 start_codon:yes stop_codon:yes gene_type:complete